MSVTERLVAQGQRPISLSTPLGEDVLALRRMTATEELGRLFSYELDLLSPDPTIRHPDLLGENVTVRLDLAAGGKRYFNGHINRFALLGFEGHFARYRATVVPWLWFLGRTSDCRIFQHKNVPDILKAVFREHGFTDFEEALSASYREAEYIVQYRETDLDFVSRLMEHEGIYYYFRHGNGKHTLVLADSYSSHGAAPGYEQIAYYPPGDNVVRQQETLWSWRVTQEVQPGSCALNDFDFTAPKKSLRSVSSLQREHVMADFEIYDYPGAYVDSGAGEAYARIRIEERQTGYEVARGEGDVRGVATGALFTLGNFPRADQNREYLVIGADYELESDTFESGGTTGEGPVYRCRLAAIDSRAPFRPRRSTPKPEVRGPQTAIVVGKAGEEIWTDEYGRVKVQFHWDRYGKADENSSCWVRVSHPLAGKRWGSIAIPRIGQEVIVEFLEGDPDRPIITGRVYNGDSMPPYDLPAAAMVSGTKSNTTPGGGGYNEISMDDSKGKERLFIHAQKDHALVVENDESHAIKHDRSKSVTHDEQTQIGNNRTESVGHDETIKIGGNRTETVTGNETVRVELDCRHTVAKNATLTVGEQLSEQIDGSRSSAVAEDDSLTVGKSLTIDVAEQIVIRTGKASITLKKDGSIILEGKDITTKGSGGINLKASKNVVIKGKKVLEN